MKWNKGKQNPYRIHEQLDDVHRVHLNKCGLSRSFDIQRPKLSFEKDEGTSWSKLQLQSELRKHWGSPTSTILIICSIVASKLPNSLKYWNPFRVSIPPFPLCCHSGSPIIANLNSSSMASTACSMILFLFRSAPIETAIRRSLARFIWSSLAFVDDSEPGEFCGDGGLYNKGEPEFSLLCAK